MPCFMYCTNDGCKKEMQPVIDKKTKKVFCTICDNEMNINYFAKQQLETLKQYKTEKKKAYGVKCDKCNILVTPVIKNNDLVCETCSSALNVSDHYKRFFFIKDSL